MGFFVAETGRQAQVWGWQKIQHTQLRHEVTATQALINMNAHSINRTNLDPAIRPDAEFALDQKYLLEMDMGTEGRRQIAKRVETLTRAPLPVVWVALSPGRLKTIRACCKPISDRCYFTTLDKAGDYWKDYQGHSKPHSKGRSQ